MTSAPHPSRRAAPLAGLVLLSCAVTAVSCGAKQPAPPSVMATTSASTKSVMAVSVVEDRSPVEAPDGLTVQLHVAAPKTVIRALKGYFPSFAGQLDARVLAGQIIGAPVLAQLIDIDQPVDAALVLRAGDGLDGLHLAYAFGLEEEVDVEARLKGAFSFEARDGGVRRLVPSHTATYDDQDLGNFRGDCWIAPALGPSKHRLVCSPEGISSGDVAILAPWLTRGVTRREAEITTLKLEVDVAALRKRFEDDLRHAHDELASESARFLKVDRPETDRVLSRLMKSTVDETFDLIADLDALTLEATMVPEGLKVAARTTFGRSISWTARAALANADGIGKAPKSLGALPSEGAWYAAFANASPGSDALVLPIQQALLQLAEATAIDDGWPTKDKDAALEIVRLLFPRSADTVMVGGEAKPDDTSVAPKPEDEWNHDAWLTRIAARKSWSLAMVARDAKPEIDLAKAFAALLTKPSFAATFKKLARDRLKLEVSVKPITGKLPKGAFGQTLDCSVKTVAGKVVPIKSVSGKDLSKSPGETLLARIRFDEIIAENVGRTFVAWSQNDGATPLIARLNDALQGTSKLPWSGREGFAAFAETSAASGAIVSVDGVARLIGQNPTRTSSWLADLPDGGKGTFSLATSASKSSTGGTATVSSFLSRDAIAGVYQLSHVLDRIF